MPSPDPHLAPSSRCGVRAIIRTASVSTRPPAELQQRRHTEPRRVQAARSGRSRKVACPARKQNHRPRLSATAFFARSRSKGNPARRLPVTTAPRHGGLTYRPSCPDTDFAPRTADRQCRPLERETLQSTNVTIRRLAADLFGTFDRGPAFLNSTAPSAPRAPGGIGLRISM